MGVVVTLVVLATALVAGLLVYIDRRDEPGARPSPAPTGGSVPPTGTVGPSRQTPLRGEIAWQKPPAPQEATTLRHDGRVTGGWFAPGLVVRMGQGMLIAYRSGDGVELWRLRPPAVNGGPGAFCAMSRSVDAGFGAVAYGIPRVSRFNNSVIYGLARCSYVGLVDLRTGRYRWTRYDGEPRFDTTQPEVAGSVVVVSQQKPMTGYSVSTGARLWRRGDDLGKGCGIKDLLATPGRITTLADCISEDFIGYFDPANGKLVAQRKLSLEGYAGNRIVNADPAVIYDNGRALRNTARYLVYDDAARFMYAVPQTGSHGVLKTWKGADPLVPQTRGKPHYDVLSFVHGQGLFVTMTVASAVSSLRNTNRIVAFDAATGRQRWSVSLDTKVTGGPVAVTADGVIAVSNGTYEKPPRVYRLALSDGRPTELSPPFPRNTINFMTGYLLRWTGSGLDGVDVLAGPSVTPPSVIALR